MAPLVAGLLKAGLSLVGNAVLAKGKAWVEEKAGVKLADFATISPETLTTLHQFELTHKEELQRLRVEDNRIEAELEKAYLIDVQSARERDKEFIKIGRRNERGDILAYLATGGLLGCALLVFVAPDLSQGQRELLIYILGALSVIVKDVYGFEFGSSKDAAKNANFIHEHLK